MVQAILRCFFVAPVHLHGVVEEELLEVVVVLVEVVDVDGPKNSSQSLARKWSLALNRQTS